MDSTYFLRQLDIADLSKFKEKPITVIGGLTYAKRVEHWPALQIGALQVCDSVEQQRNLPAAG